MRKAVRVKSEKQYRYDTRSQFEPDEKQTIFSQCRVADAVAERCAYLAQIEYRNRYKQQSIDRRKKEWMELTEN
jgi:hypothetical protein